MALTRTFNPGAPLRQRGQGAVEAFVALPVFLILICLIFQLFFLGVAQMQLQYAAFYAARVGAVHNSDQVQMRRAVKRILAGSPGLMSMPEGSFEVEILDAEKKREEIETVQDQNRGTLKVRVHWHYPLIIPLADTFLKTRSLFPVPGRPTVHLRASWAMTMVGSFYRDEDRAGN